MCSAPGQCPVGVGRLRLVYLLMKKLPTCMQGRLAETNNDNLCPVLALSVAEVGKYALHTHHTANTLVRAGMICPVL